MNTPLAKNLFFNPEFKRLTNLITTLISFICMSTHGFPFNGTTMRLQQPDNSTILVQVYGDEFYQDIESIEGFTLIRDSATGWICYAEATEDKMNYRSSGYLYPNKTPLHSTTTSTLRTNQQPFTQHLRRSPAKIADMIQKNTLTNYSNRNSMKNIFTTQQTYDSRSSVDTIIGLTLCVQFSDTLTSVPTTAVEKFCNQKGYNEFGNNGSVADYISDISQKKIVYRTIVPNIITLEKPKSYYDNRSNTNATVELITDALSKLEISQSLLKEITRTSSNNSIQSFAILYAGSPECGWSEGLWPHFGQLEREIAIQGIRISSYQISGIGSELSLGTYCHETCHMLFGWPDLYSYDNHSFGVGSYCIMGYMDEKNPQVPNAYLRLLQGWISSKDITFSENGTNFYLSTTSDNAGFQALIYSSVKTGKTGELFCIEARDHSGRNGSLPDHGLIIWHIDEKGSNLHAWNNDFISLEQADNKFDLELLKNKGDTNDLFEPGSSPFFTDATSPSAQWHTGRMSGLTLSCATRNSSAWIITIGQTQSQTPLIHQETKPYPLHQITTIHNNTLSINISSLGAGSVVPVSITLYSISGKLIMPINTTYYKEGIYEVSLITHLKNISTGVYVLRTTIGEQSMSVRFTKK